MSGNNGRTPTAGDPYGARSDEPTKDERALRVMTVFFGSASMVAWPSAIIYPPALLLMFSIPMAMATAGRLENSRRWQQVAIGVGAVLAATFAAGIAAVVGFIMTVGPIPVAFVVGRLIRRIDPLAGSIWLIAAALAYGVGVLLITALPNFAFAVAIGLMATGFVVATLRVRRRPSLAT